MDKAERDERILSSDKSARELAQELGVSRSTVYNVRRARAPEPSEHFDDFRSSNRSLKGKRKFDQLALSGLMRFGSQVQEEFQRELQDDTGIKIYTEMATHPVAAAILFAIQMAQRQVNWFVQPASDSDEDKEAAEFVDQSLDDMSQTWDDVVSQVFTMLKYGFSICELVYKKRLGQKPPKYIKDPARSRFNDGLVGWRRWQFISPRSMPASNRWEFDEYGRVQAVFQEPAPDYQLRTIPMEKALLFRTQVEWDNPEGLSILRSMYQPWYYAENLAEIEAIGAERLGLGLPVFYMGRETSKGGADSDFVTFRDIVRNVRADEQMGLVIPYPKMGSGAPEGEGALFELVSPPSRGIVDFDKVITRYEQRMAMVVLAQFIFLGMTKVGTQALAESTIDVFQLAITAWSDMLASVVNRFAIPRLMAFNPFKLEALPTLGHSDIAVPNLAEVSSFVNQLVGSEVLTPDEQLETYLRELAGLPERAEAAVEISEAAVGEEEDDLSDLLDENFVQRLRQGGPKWERAANAYETELRRTYQVWADETAAALAQADDEQDFSDKLDEAVEVLIAALILLGRRRLPEGFQLGLAGVPSTPAGIQELSDALASNEDFLTNSLSPGILTKMRQRVMDDPLIATDKASLVAVFGTFLARIGSYAGAFWSLVQRGFGDRVRQDPTNPRTRWVLDRRAKHCDTCLQFGSVAGKVYDSYDAMLIETGGTIPAFGTICDGNCRCWLEYESKSGVWKRM